MMSAPLKLEFTHNRTATYLRFNWFGFCILLLGIAALIAAWQYHAGLLQAKSDLLASINKIELILDTKQAKYKPQAKVEMAPKTMKALEVANKEIEVPWTTLFNTLEDAQHRHIALLEVQPDSKKQRVLLTGEAKNYASIIAYIELLERQPALQDVYLQKHLVNEDVLGQPVQFVIGASWLYHRRLQSS